MSQLIGSGLCLVAVVGGCARMETATEKRAGHAPAAKVAQAAPQKQDAAAAVKVPSQRKIIYTADVCLVTDDLDGFRTRLTSSLEVYQGFVSAQQMTGRTGLQRTGVWTVRVPEERFSEFLDQLISWGELESQKINSDDVTEEFVDVESRLKNKRIEESRLLTILAEKTGELEQVVALERAISEVREQIERMEGRMRYLTEKVELTTITITAREVQDYVPPQPPTLTTEISRTFSASLHNVQDCGKQLLLVLVAFVPWMIPLAIVALPTALIVRRFHRHVILFADEAHSREKK